MSYDIEKASVRRATGAKPRKSAVAILRSARAIIAKDDGKHWGQGGRFLSNNRVCAIGALHTATDTLGARLPAENALREECISAFGCGIVGVNDGHKHATAEGARKAILRMFDRAIERAS